MGKTQRVAKHVTKKAEVEVKSETAVANKKQEEEKIKKAGRQKRIVTPAEAKCWSVYGILCGVLLVVAAAVFLIIRFTDEAWSSWQLPTIFVILYLMTIAAGALLISLKSVHTEIRTKGQAAAVKPKQESSETKKSDMPM